MLQRYTNYWDNLNHLLIIYFCQLFCIDKKADTLLQHCNAYII